MVMVGRGIDGHGGEGVDGHGGEGDRWAWWGGRSMVMVGIGGIHGHGGEGGLIVMVGRGD